MIDRKLDGLRELCDDYGWQVDGSATEKLISAWTDRLMQRLGFCAERGTVTAKEVKQAELLAAAVVIDIQQVDCPERGGREVAVLEEPGSGLASARAPVSAAAAGARTPTY